MNDKIALLERKVAERRVWFEQSLPDRLDTIAATLEQARDRRDTGAATELHRLFHSLAGTAGTFGLAAVAATAQQAERACAGLLSDENAFTHASSLLRQIRIVAAGQVAA